jgi:hypothetical protein
MCPAWASLRCEIRLEMLCKYKHTSLFLLKKQQRKKFYNIETRIVWTFVIAASIVAAIYGAGNAIQGNKHFTVVTYGCKKGGMLGQTLYL